MRRSRRRSTAPWPALTLALAAGEHHEPVPRRDRRGRRDRRSTSAGACTAGATSAPRSISTQARRERRAQPPDPDAHPDRDRHAHRVSDPDCHTHADPHGHSDRHPVPGPAPATPPRPRPRPPAPIPLPARRAPSAIADFTTLPAASTCVRNRKLTVRFKKPPKGYVVKTVTVKVNAKQVATLKGAKLKQPLYLRKLPKRTFTVTVSIKLTKGKGLTERRRYTACK